MYAFDDVLHSRSTLIFGQGPQSQSSVAFAATMALASAGYRAIALVDSTPDGNQFLQRVNAWRKEAKQEIDAVFAVMPEIRTPVGIFTTIAKAADNRKSIVLRDVSRNVVGIPETWLEIASDVADLTRGPVLTCATVRLRSEVALDAAPAIIQCSEKFNAIGVNLHYLVPAERADIKLDAHQATEITTYTLTETTRIGSAA